MMDKLKRYQGFYKKIDRLVSGLESFMKDEDYKKLKSSGYMDLSIDVLATDRISIAHNFIQNGDVVPDPDMEVKIDHVNKVAYPVTYQDMIRYDSPYEFGEDGYPVRYNRRLAQSLDSFFSMWLINLKNQGFYK